MNPPQALCHVCQKGPYLLCNLYKHLRKVHRFTDEDIHVLQNGIKRTKYEGKPELMCEDCGKIFYSPDCLRIHKTSVHASTTTEGASPSKKVQHVVCPGCDERFYCNQELAEHCQAAHKEEGVDVSEEKKRYRKSKKVHTHCPCFAKITERKDGTVEVVACFGHLGHVINAVNNSISSEEEEAIRTMLTVGVSPQEILTMIRSEYWVIPGPMDANNPRICHITLDDIRSIARCNGLTYSGMNEENRNTVVKGTSFNNDESAATSRCGSSRPPESPQARTLVDAPAIPAPTAISAEASQGSYQKAVHESLKNIPFVTEGNGAPPRYDAPRSSEASHPEMFMDANNFIVPQHIIFGNTSRELYEKADHELLKNVPVFSNEGCNPRFDSAKSPETHQGELFFGDEFIVQPHGIFMSGNGDSYQKAAAAKAVSSVTPRAGGAPSRRVQHVVCPGCDQRFFCNQELAEHCLAVHHDDWKASEERRTCSGFTKRRTKMYSTATVVHYVCQYSGGAGIYAEQERRRGRRSKKVHTHCPCFAKVTERRDGTIEVVACFGHLGHAVNAECLPITPQDEETIKSMLSAGVAPQDILNTIKPQNWMGVDTHSRTSYLTLSDIKNIARRHGLIYTEVNGQDHEPQKAVPIFAGQESGSVPRYDASRCPETSRAGLFLGNDMISRQQSAMQDINEESFRKAKDVHMYVGEILHSLFIAKEMQHIERLRKAMEDAIGGLPQEFVARQARDPPSRRRWVNLYFSKNPPIMIISLNFVWITVYCSKWSKRSKKINSAQSVSYIEEDTKREEHFVRPDWDKDFPKILPPPVRVPEKENKEVDVELDMNLMPPADKPLGDLDLLRSDVIDPNKKTSASAKNRKQLEVNQTQDSVVQQPQVVDDRKGAGETKPPAGKSPLECKK
ncbi:unnamed protein product [Nippostrongylus brasiliensis]|uniref:C2H2-type domain-containing protein n=1 Tax=Nippostrongylus brasiliensis TaxID=27835 RepID=A0A0N4XUU5_NIPBR|nr:unnamed protein product [Nippostrongylus brasiliensis]